MTIAPGKSDIKIYQGATFREEMIITDTDDQPIEFTGYTARAQAREEYISPTPFMNLTTENGGITLGATDGTVTLVMSAAATAAITAEHGVWDLELVQPNGEVWRVLQGEVCVSKEATR